MKLYTESDLRAFGERELVELILKLQDTLASIQPENCSRPCHVCGTMIAVDELNENWAYTHDGKPHCPAHYPTNE